jgi:uncharacterized Zn-binding protein involved in type VI secretion
VKPLCARCIREAVYALGQAAACTMGSDLAPAPCAVCGKAHCHCYYEEHVIEAAHQAVRDRGKPLAVLGSAATVFPHCLECGRRLTEPFVGATTGLDVRVPAFAWCSQDCHARTFARARDGGSR